MPAWIVPAAIGAATALSRFIGPDPVKWQQNALVNILNNLAAANQFGLDRITEMYFGPQGVPGLFPRLFQAADYGEGMLFGNEAWGQPGLIPALDAYRGALDPRNLINAWNADIWWGPGMVDALLQQQELGGQVGDLGRLAGQVFTGGGWTPGYQALQTGAFPLMFGQNPMQQILGSTATNILGTGGYTPGLAALQQLGLGELLAGGATPASLALQGIGLSRFAEDAVMRPELAASMAADRASRNLAQQAAKVREQALLRGGGPGAIVAAGTQNDLMADFADEAAQVQAQAVQDALLKQQELMLRQQALGAEAVREGLASELGRMGLVTNFLTTPEEIAARRLQIGGGLGQGYTESILRALGTYGDVERALNQYALGAGDLAGRLIGRQAELKSMIPQWQLEGARMALDRARTLEQILGGGLGSMLRLGELYNTWYMQPWAHMGNLMNMFENYSRTGLAGMPNIFGPINWSAGENNPWTEMMRNIAGAIPIGGKSGSSTAPTRGSN